MLYQFVGGPYNSKTVMESDDFDANDPPNSFDVFDDDEKYPVPIFAFSYMLIRIERINNHPLHIYQYAGRCDNLRVRRCSCCGGSMS